MSHLSFSVIPSVTLIFVLLGQSYSMKVSFCDRDKLVTLKDNQCPGGVNFGVRKPDCVCISGIYRMWMDNCVVYDGFMENGCSTLTQEEWNVVGLRLTGKIQSLTNSTAAVYSKKDSDYQTWSAYPIGQNGSSTADDFYTINGNAYLFFKNGRGNKKKHICVEKRVKKVDQICRYYRTEDDPIWSPDDGELDIMVKNTCEQAPIGFKRIALKPESCYSVFKKEDSECSLSCLNPLTKNKYRITPELAVSSEDDALNRLYRQTSDSISAIETENEIDDKDNIIQGGLALMALVDPNLQPSDTGLNFTDFDRSNLTQITVTQQLTANNFFLNRKLNHYSKLRQVGYLQPNDLRMIQPTRTFELLDIIRDIGKKACADKYVSSLFIDQAVDLFVILHKGRNYRYTEDLDDKEFQWIRRILTGCLLDTTEMNLVNEVDELSEQCKDNQKVKGVCPENLNTNSDSNCSDLSISESHSHFGKFHFVVEAAWDLIDLTQIVCFPSFSQSYRMFHHWEQASEKLFTREIRKLWYNPNLSMKVYQNLLTPSAQIDMYNLEMCVEGAYKLNPSLTRLNRPSEPRRFFRRKKRDVKTPGKSTTKNYDVICRKTEPEFEYPC